MLESVKVYSNSDGSLQVLPVYRHVQPYTEQDGGGPGLHTRMAVASRLEKVINTHLRGRK